MPIKIDRGLPTVEILRTGNIFVMDDNRAQHQDIRPMNILILNRMPQKDSHRNAVVEAISQHASAVRSGISSYGQSSVKEYSYGSFGDFLQDF